MMRYLPLSGQIIGIRANTKHHLLGGNALNCCTIAKANIVANEHSVVVEGN